jgi:hypothetical protein
MFPSLCWPKPKDVKTCRLIETNTYYFVERGNLPVLKGIYFDSQAGIYNTNPKSGRSLFLYMFDTPITLNAFSTPHGLAL